MNTTKTNSDQERIVKTLSELSIGAPFVFLPDKYKKGKSTREPADLAIACNNCVILVYMTKKQGDPHSEPRVAEQRHQKLIDHNLNQAEGWLNEWREGRLLVGKNKFNRFSIKHDDYKYLVILSVIDSKSAKEEFHYDKTMQFNVTLCGTLSQESFESLANVRAGTLDFVSVLIALKNSRGNNVVSKYITDQKALADPDKRWLDVINQPIILKTYHAILTSLKGSDGDAALAINDMFVSEVLTLVILLADFFLMQKRENTLMVATELKFNYYDVVVGLSNMPNMLALQQKILKRKEEYIKPTVIIFTETTFGTSIIAYEKKNDKSFTEILIESS